ncbi:MAG TPA: hypothetical protein VKE69_04200, partial [Planctomycetota bacterium]|nr:hypothetical protein [Planctomycetota bacterium]
MAPTLAALALAAALFQDPVPAAPAPAPPQGDLIPLRDGQIVVGEITSHGEDGIDVTRLDNGGVVHLRWSHLTPPAEQRLRAELGYVADDATDEILVEGDEVVFLDGTRKVGLLDPTSTPDVIRLNEKGNVWVYTRDKLAGAPAKVRVSALSLYTRDQLYAQWSSELDLSTPAGNLELASRLERVRDYARALDHVRKAAELDASWRPQEIASRRARLEERSKRQAEYDQIAEIDVQRNRRRWDAALGLADEFLSKYPKSPSKPDVEKKKTTIQAARQTDLVRRTFELWSMQMERLVSKKAIDRTLDLEAAKAWATGELKELVRAEV